MSDRGAFASLHSGLIYGLETLKVRSRESREEMQEKAAVDRDRPADAEAFDRLFEVEREDVARVCHRLLDDSAAAEDASSEVFLRARRALSSYDRTQPFRPWLRAIASNYCIDQLRRQRTERKLFSRAELTEDGLADPTPDVLRCLTRSQERREVLGAIDSLPAKYRLPLVLRFYRDLDYEAIAELLGVTRNQVGSLLFRAKLQLRERLASGVEGVDRETSDALPSTPSRRRRRTRSPASTSKSNRSAKP